VEASRRQPVRCGMRGGGQAAATRAFAAVERDAPVDLVFSLGWAGALRTDLAPGVAYNAAGVIDARTGERFNCDAGAGAEWLVTSPVVADEREKAATGGAYGRGWWIWRLQRLRGWPRCDRFPFYCIKGVSDGLGRDCLISIGLSGLMDDLKLARFVLFVLVRPKYWPN